ncbi:hypothetical protein BST61_g10658 [Cercospora zeina]
MCQHVRVKYACGHIRYCVLCWCSRYTDLQKCCPLQVRRHETLSVQRCGYCRDTNSLTRRACMDKNTLPTDRVAKRPSSSKGNATMTRPKPFQVS